MKKIELTFDDVEKRILPNGMLPVDAKWIEAIVVNANSFLDRKHREQYECSQVEWFKLSEKRPMSGHTVLWIEENWYRPTIVRYVDDLAKDRAHKIYWTPCPNLPEFDSPCVKELKEYFKSKNGFVNIQEISEIVKRHEEKEKE